MQIISGEQNHVYNLVAASAFIQDVEHSQDSLTFHPFDIFQPTMLCLQGDFNLLDNSFWTPITISHRKFCHDHKST